LLPDLLRRTVAAGSALLVLVLTVFAVTPDLHHLVHDSGSPEGAEECAVDLFANGVSLPTAVTTALPATAAWLSAVPAIAEEIHLPSPRYLRQPERGPPVLV